MNPMVRGIFGTESPAVCIASVWYRSAWSAKLRWRAACGHANALRRGVNVQKEPRRQPISTNQLMTVRRCTHTFSRKRSLP